MNSVTSKNHTDLFFNQVFHHCYGFILSRSIYAITKLGVTDAIGDKPLSIADIARNQGIKHPEKLERLMNFLASRDIFAKSESGLFSHTPLSKDLAWERSGKNIVHYHDLRWDKLAKADEASLQALEDEDEPKNQVEQLSRLFVQARSIYIACSLHVFENMQKFQPQALQKQLEKSGLVEHGGLTERGALFLDQNCRAFVLHETEERWQNFGKLDEVVKEGRFPTRDYFKSLQTQPEGMQIFSDAMAFISEFECRHLTASLKKLLQGNRSVMDVGGGKGRFLQEILATYPEVHGILFDLAENISTANLDEAVRSRCSLVAGDFFEAVPTADVYLFKRVLHDWSDEQCVKILKTCAASAKANSRLVLNEFVLPQFEALMIDTLFLPLLEGRQRTQEEFRRILDEAGWKMESCERTACWLGQIVASKK